MDILIENISHRYDGLKVLSDVSLDIRRGEILCIVGPSGCGKSTLLRLIGGLQRPTDGQIVQVGSPANDCLNPLTYVFQDFALLPWRTVFGNISLALEMHQLGRKKIHEIVGDVLALTKLSNFSSAFPKQLSGGMKQRVGIARALAARPSVMLLDEPLSALDSQTRELLMEELVDLWCQKRFTAVYVTHNLEEAVRLGHRIVVLSGRPGQIREIIEIDRPISERNIGDELLEHYKKHLLELLRTEAADVDEEFSRGR